MDAVTNVGIRPTFDESSLTIETFVLNDAVPEGAARARIEFLHRLRDEKRFNSPDDLRTQIAVDVRRAQRFFSSVFGSSARRG
jgi:riboflavin kinase/FMN adenylyltransferase